MTAQIPVAALVMCFPPGRRNETLPAGVAESLEREGWSPEHPARLQLQRGSPPEILDGRHRVSYLWSIGRRGLLVPTELVLC